MCVMADNRPCSTLTLKESLALDTLPTGVFTYKVTKLYSGG